LDSWQGKEIFPFSETSRPPGPTQPLIQWVPHVLSQEIKRLEHEPDSSPPSRAGVKNEWNSSHLIRLHACTETNLDLYLSNISKRGCALD